MSSVCHQRSYPADGSGPIRFVRSRQMTGGSFGLLHVFATAHLKLHCKFGGPRREALAFEMGGKGRRLFIKVVLCLRFGETLLVI